MSETRCELCGRAKLRLTRHHLIPRTRHSNKTTKKTFTREDAQGRIAMLCRPCHSTVHATFSEKELERDYNTVAALLAQPEIATWVAWIAGKPPGFRPAVRKRARR